MRKKIGQVALLIFINLIVIAVLLEIGLRLMAPNLPGQIGVAARYVSTGQPYSQAWEPAWQRSSEHFYALRPGIDEEVQYGSPTVSFTVSTIELWEGGGIGFRTDPIDFAPDGVVVGDSFGFCFTERVDCWVDVLANQTGRKLVNLSQPVTGTVSHGRILADFGAPLEPPLVLWQFFGNDFNDDYGLAVSRDEIEPVAADDSASGDNDDTSLGGWLRHNSAAYAVIETLFTGLYLGTPESEALYVKPLTATYGPNSEHVLQFGGEYEQGALDMSLEQNQIGLELSRTAFEDAQALVAGWDGEIAVIIMPTREEVYASITEPVMGQEAIDKLASARMAMLDLCDELSLRCYDPTQAFIELAQAGEALYHSDDMHLNAHGNAILVELLQAWLGW
ncbi:MAG: hypothetical protein CL607_00185 [Anaerolineaceae bacterium]|nr:hypothetical protein [Anaerolineaceae bacterium]